MHLIPSITHQSTLMEILVLDRNVAVFICKYSTGGMSSLVNYASHAAPRGKVHNEHICFQYGTIIFRVGDHSIQICI